MGTIEEIINLGSEKNATDIHICAGRPVQYRLQGILNSLNDQSLSPELTKNYAKSLAGENIYKQLEEDLSVDFAKTVGDGVRIRCNIYKESGNYACAIRILPKDIPSVEGLLIPLKVLEISKKTKGLILVTGPTGHGKTTTLASIIDGINQGEKKHIITLEDPIEYLHYHKNSIVNQREIGIDVKTFGSGLRDSLRQDPDIIMVGEMRDCETIATALTAAETGHLVFGTLHTMDCASTISRIVDVFPPDQQEQIRVMLADVIECVVSQRLVPLIDGTRQGVHEVMTATPAIRSLIRDNKVFQIYSQIQISQKDGMQTMEDSLLEVYKKGLGKKSELLKFSNNPEALERKMM